MMLNVFVLSTKPVDMMLSVCLLSTKPVDMMLGMLILHTILVDIMWTGLSTKPSDMTPLRI
jgi:hypothetical protein